MEFSVIRHLILCEVLISPVLGNLATCLSPSIRRGETATIACRFEPDINALQIDFQVDRYSLDPSDSIVETVLFCHWNNGVRSCKTAIGYEYDESVVDQFNITVPNAMEKHAGQYVCQTVPSEPGEIQACNLHIIGILATCLSPAALSGETATINCRFDEDINALHKDFRVNRHSLDPSDSLSETVLSCHWTDGDRFCKTANGYEYDESVVDQFNIKVPNAMVKHAGRYACQTVPSEPEDIQTCYLYIIESPDGYKTTVIALPSVTGVLAIALLIFVIRRICLRKNINISEDVPGTINDEDKPPTTPVPEKIQQVNPLLNTINY